MGLCGNLSGNAYRLTRNVIVINLIPKQSIIGYENVKLVGCGLV